jgi:hypothetical protein
MRLTTSKGRKPQTPAPPNSRKPSDKPHGELLEAYLHFIVHPAKSVREERKESGGVANKDNQTQKFPETERAGYVD